MIPSAPPPSVDDLIGLLLAQARDVAFVFLDAAGTVVGWMGGAERMFGYAAGDAKGRSFDSLVGGVHEAKQGSVAAPTPAQLNAPDIAAGRARWYLRKDGSRVWISSVTVPLHGAGGVMAGFAKVLRDVTDEKTQFDALTRRNQALQATRDEHVAALRRLSHELRDPLAPLTAAAALLRRLVTSAGLEMPLAVIDRQLAVITRLADDLGALAGEGGGTAQ